MNIIAKDYSFLPDSLDLVPGETVLLHVINGGLVVHEAVIGDASVPERLGGGRGRDRERAARSDAARQRPARRVRDPDRGRAPAQRVDLAWTVPPGVAAPGASPWIVGCHIPGHWERGMQIPVHWVASGTTP